MGIFKFFRRENAQAAQPRAQVAGGQTFTGFDDPKLLEFIKAGVNGLGDSVFLRNMAALRCTTLISNSIGMLPLNLMLDKELAKKHPAYRLLKKRPNDWLTPVELKSFIQLQVLLHGNGYARVVWSRGKPISLIPLKTTAVTPELKDGFRMVYKYTAKNGDYVELPAKDVLHVRDLSLDGVTGISRMRLAQGAIELAQLAEEAAMRIFKTGVMAGGSLETDKALSETAFSRIKNSLETEFSGVTGANMWMLLEEGLKANKFANTATDAQQIENRNHQIEEVARLYGVPRPLLMMDDTSWGSGIEQLAIFFVQYTLAPWFVAWEQALARVLLTEDEYESYYFKFNEKALLRGTLKDQADFFAKALGAGGQRPWMTQNEVRKTADLPPSIDPAANELRNPMTQKNLKDEPTQTT